MQLDSQLREFLQQRHIARVTTIQPDGYPHTVPVWYMLDGDDIVIATGSQTQKVRNIRTNPKGAVVIGGNPLDADITYQPCYLFQGDFVIDGEPGFDWITRIAYRYRDDREQTDRDIQSWGPHQLIRLKIRSIMKVMP